MARQSNEDSAVLQGGRKVAATRADEPVGGGKGIPVNQQAQQLELFFGTAESSESSGSEIVGRTGSVRKEPVKHAVPKPKDKNEKCASAMMERVVENLRTAFHKVKRNKGAPGPDGQSIQMVESHLDEILPALGQSLLDGTYRPGDIRRVWIPKASGGQRGLGIPNVVDRMVQEAVRMELEPLYEPTFHASSHGFRPSRSCHTAVAEAVAHVDEGYEWVVDFDLEKFFDRVNHQRLLARLAKQVQDHRVLVLIGRMLKAKVVLKDGVVVSTDEGVPQGGPLSPLLSNVVLDELDRELDRRGHRFVRYADDCNIYVRSERAGHRVMESMTRFIERRLRLKVNRSKSAVARTEERHFVGFSLRRRPEDAEIEVLLSKRSKERIRQKIREMTPRTWGQSLEDCIHHLNGYLNGWFGFFGICTEVEEKTFAALDAHTRRRLRAIQLKQWKRKQTIARKLVKLGVRHQTAWRRVYEGRRSIWALSHIPAVERGLRNAYFAERGLVFLVEKLRQRHQRIVASEEKP